MSCETIWGCAAGVGPSATVTCRGGGGGSPEVRCCGWHWRLGRPGLLVPSCWDACVAPGSCAAGRSAWWLVVGWAGTLLCVALGQVPVVAQMARAALGEGGVPLSRGLCAGEASEAGSGGGLLDGAAASPLQPDALGVICKAPPWAGT